jgi:lipopolysaccharide heptosyltransferase III
MSTPGLGKKLEYLGRDFIYALMRLILPRRRDRGPIDPAQIKTVCVMRIEEKIGDLLMTVPLMRSAKLTFPNAEVTALVGMKQVKLIEGIAEVDRVVGFNKRDALNPLKLLGLLRELRRPHYDLVFEASSWNALSINSVLVMKLGLRHTLSVGHPTDLADRFFDYRPPIVEDINEIRRSLGLLQAVDGAKITEEVALPPWSVPSRVDRLIENAGLKTGKFMLLHPGAYRKVRRWNYDAHRRFCDLVRENFGLSTLVIYGVGEQEEAPAIRAALGSYPVLEPDLTLEEVVGLMRRARFVMTMNSGPMHLSVGSGTPTLAFAVGIDPYQ